MPLPRSSSSALVKIPVPFRDGEPASFGHTAGDNTGSRRGPSDEQAKSLQDCNGLCYARLWDELISRRLMSLLLT